jgi:hypothetical protein
MCRNCYKVTYFKFAPGTACICIFTRKRTFCGRVLNSIASVALVREAVDEIRITSFLNPFQ